MSDQELYRCRLVSVAFHCAHRTRSFIEINGRTHLRLRVNRFDVSRMNMKSLSYVIGNRASGKTTLAHSLAQKTIIKYPGTMFVNHDKIGYRAEELAKYTAALERNGTFGVVLLDDCFFEHDQWRRPVEALRECNASVVMTITVGFMFDFPNIARIARYVFLFRETILSSQKRIFESFGRHIFRSQALFMQTWTACTCRQGECLVLDLHEKKFYWHRDRAETP